MWRDSDRSLSQMKANSSSSSDSFKYTGHTFDSDINRVINVDKSGDLHVCMTEMNGLRSPQPNVIAASTCTYNTT
ncbi:unnamed protein product [Sphagnum jensenii]|uniref:Uncharacterized protein n=1 Tax=Sphagnum jensenii TaxID=128206 RepID=A0ABP0V9C8_9BRYO